MRRAAPRRVRHPARRERADGVERLGGTARARPLRPAPHDEQDITSPPDPEQLIDEAPDDVGRIDAVRDECDRAYVDALLAYTNDNISEAARVANKSRRWLQLVIKKLGIAVR